MRTPPPIRVRLSILDQSPIISGHDARRAIAETLALARRADELGYYRYWLAEHHAIAALADPCPEVLVARLGAETQRLRVGTGGVLLPYYSAFRMAEAFRMLETLYPGRIDLGLGRAPGGDFSTMAALRRGLGQSGEEFPDLLGELRTYLGPEKPGQAVRATPGQNSNVPVYLLGSSSFSAQLAAKLGMPFAFAAHFAPEYLGAASDLYHANFRPSGDLREPYMMVATQVIAAETDAEAQRLFTTPQQRFLRLIRNQPVELLPPVDSMRCTFFVTVYGVTSRRRSVVIPASPVRSPSCDEMPGFVGDHSGQLSRSANRSMSRQMPKPKVFVAAPA